MNKCTHVIRQAKIDTGETIKLWRETQYRDGSLRTIFFVDIREDDMLTMRVPYEQLNEALDKYYKLAISACMCGNRAISARVTDNSF